MNLGLIEEEQQAEFKKEQFGKPVLEQLFQDFWKFREYQPNVLLISEKVREHLSQFIGMRTEDILKMKTDAFVVRQTEDAIKVDVFITEQTDVLPINIRYDL